MANPAPSSNIRARLTWAMLQHHLLRVFCPNRLNGMSVCPSTTNTEGCTTLSMPEQLRLTSPGMGLASLSSSPLEETTIAQCLGSANCKRFLRPLGLTLKLKLGTSPFPTRPPLLPVPPEGPAPSSLSLTLPSLTLSRKCDSGGDGRGSPCLPFLVAQFPSEVLLWVPCKLPTPAYADMHASTSLLACFHLCIWVQVPVQMPGSCMWTMFCYVPVCADTGPYVHTHAALCIIH